MTRRDKTNYYLDIAETVLTRGTCMRRLYGAIIVKNDQIISTGYGGAPRGRANCTDLGYCTRDRLQIPRGQRYELCRSVHAEANAIAYAARHGVSLEGAELFATDSPCYTCACLLINAGITAVVFTRKYRDDSGLRLLADVGVRVYHVNLIDEEVPPSEDSNPYEVRPPRFASRRDDDQAQGPRIP